MVNRLPTWFFLALALILLGMSYAPFFRVLIGVDSKMEMQFWTVIMLLIGGLMSGLTAMILLVRRQAKIDWSKAKGSDHASNHQRYISVMHACGLLLYSGLPLLNFLAVYYLWIRNRNSSESIDRAGTEILDFQITIYLYLLLSLFLVFAVIGLFTTPLILLLHSLSTLIALFMSLNASSNDSPFRYVANIPITYGRPAKD